MHLISKTVAALLAAGFLSIGSMGASSAGFSVRCEDKTAQRYSSRYPRHLSQVRPRPRAGRPPPVPAQASPVPPRAYQKQPDWVQNLYREYGATAGNF